jgi:D-amino-acid oxidase
VRVVVVGAGISGLTCALALRDAGHAVTVLAAEPPGDTTSAVSAALWYPYRALPEREVTRWAAATYAALLGLRSEPAAGVRLRTGRELFRAPAPDPWWRDAVPDLERVAPQELPAGFADGYRLQVPVVDTSLHLPWLRAQLSRRGVELRLRRLSSLLDADPGADVVVDCAGLGAERLAGDRSLVPVRGQIVVVEQVGVEQWLLAQAGGQELTYVVPRERTVLLGGTAEEGARSTVPDPATARALVARCVALVPELARAPVLAHRAGLRPTRPAVRVEVGRLASGQPVVHDYGHGGAGVTLSYGCAADVVRLVREL